MNKRTLSDNFHGMIPRQQGFTLFEIAMVLIVVGLIVAGIVLGKNMIRSAEIRKTISQLEKFDTSVNSFRNKYNGMAGDISNATQLFNTNVQPDLVSDGNGNGKIDDLVAGGTTGTFFSTERAYMIDQLAVSKLLDLSPFDETSAQFGVTAAAAGKFYPKTTVGDGMIIIHAGVNNGGGYWLPLGKHYAILGISVTNTSDNWVSTSAPSISAPDAYTLDSKIDDGYPLTGRVRALEPSAGDDDHFGGLLATPADGSCVSLASCNPYSYNDADKCAVAIRTSF